MATMVLTTRDRKQAKTRSRALSFVLPVDSLKPATYSTPNLAVRARRRTVTAQTFVPFLAVTAYPRKPCITFANLPLEIIWAILSTASRSSIDEAKAVACLCKYARRLALPALFSVRSLRDARSVQTFLGNVQLACPLTPVGALVTSLWLTVTRAWPVEAVRAVIRSCPNIERLALTSISALVPWAACTDTRPLFADAAPGTKLELTLVGNNTAEDIWAFAQHDPASAGAMGQRLTAFRVLKLRSAFNSRSTGTPAQSSAASGTVSPSSDEGVVAAMISICQNVQVVSVPYGQVAATMEDSMLESSFAKELELLGNWVQDVQLPSTTAIELLVSDSDLEHMSKVDGVEKKRAVFCRPLQMVQWPRNVDAARERWMAES
jgi:hypothetical protein